AYLLHKKAKSKKKKNQENDFGLLKLGRTAHTIVSSAGTPVTSQKECTEDPSILCQDFATALKCGSLERCHQMLQVNGPKNLKCTLCKFTVVIMAKIVQDNITDERLAKFFESGCQYLPFQDWSIKCKKMVDTGVIILVELGKQVQ
ncbi:hypothetical protein Chor_013837, partial [Crotalus horridus]